MKITRAQIRRIIRETWENEKWNRTGANWDRSERGIRRGSGSMRPLSQASPAHRQGYHDAYQGLGSKRKTDDPEYKKGYETGLADLEAGKPAPEDLKPKRRRR